MGTVFRFDALAMIRAVFRAPIDALFAGFTSPHIIALANPIIASPISMTRIRACWFFAGDSKPIWQTFAYAGFGTLTSPTAVLRAGLGGTVCPCPHLTFKRWFLDGFAFTFPGSNVADTVVHVSTRAIYAFITVIAFTVPFHAFPMVIALVGACRMLAMFTCPRGFAVANALNAYPPAAAVVAAFLHVAVRSSITMETTNRSILQNFSMYDKSGAAIVSSIPSVAVALSFCIAYSTVVAIHRARFEPAVFSSEALSASALSISSVANTLATALWFSWTYCYVTSGPSKSILTCACPIQAGTVSVAAAWATTPITVFS